MSFRLLLLLALAVSNGGADAVLPSNKVRKTLSFWTDKPHARFITHPLPTHQPPQLIEEEPIEIARKFIQTLMPIAKGVNEYGFYIRADSYTDQGTGISHVYAKQIFRGLTVIDGDVNVNVWKGTVISHGNSFFSSNAAGSVHHGGTKLQVPFEQPVQEVHTRITDCDRPIAHDGGCGSTNQLSRALLNFLQLVHPDDKVLSSLRSSFTSHLQSIQVRRLPSLPNDDSIIETAFVVHGLPGLSDEVQGSGVKAQLVYAQTPEGGLELAWNAVVELPDNVYDATLSAVDPLGKRFFSYVDWVSDSSSPPTVAESVDSVKEDESIYLVFPLGVNDPTDGVRRTITHSENIDKDASPYGWHTIPLSNIPSGSELPDCAIVSQPALENMTLVTFTSTVGNNVFAQENFDATDDLTSFVNKYRPETCPENAVNNFSFSYAPGPAASNSTEDRTKEAQKHINASITELFYLTNIFHDVMYRYGFDEQSGNFQEYNFGRGGEENDAVIAYAQDGGGYNNANFWTFPDGTKGRMRMYLFNTALPYRDSSFDAGIVIHELAHGLSTRLTGGPKDASCLGKGEAQGMGEGWGDFLSIIIRRQQAYKDYVMAGWSTNNTKGFRQYPYSLNTTVNPDDYKSLDKYKGGHARGAVWAEMLLIVSQRLIEKHGFRNSIIPPPVNSTASSEFFKDANFTIPRHGNTLMVRLLLIGMKLQPCRPRFIDARDAILQADWALTGGENHCTIWSGFAERGLGTDARLLRWSNGTAVRFNGFQVPPECAR